MLNPLSLREGEGREEERRGKGRRGEGRGGEGRGGEKRLCEVCVKYAQNTHTPCVQSQVLRNIINH